MNISKRSFCALIFIWIFCIESLFLSILVLLVIDVLCCNEYSPYVPIAEEIRYITIQDTTEELHAEQSVTGEEPSIDEEFEYLVRCVEAEAGGETELGKRLVCDVVLNRYEKWGYDSIIDVINDPCQFSVVGDGRICTVEPAESTYRIVEEELKSKTNTEVLYFRAGHYHDFGTPMFQEKGHYFSKE